MKTPELLRARTTKIAAAGLAGLTVSEVVRAAQKDPLTRAERMLSRSLPAIPMNASFSFSGGIPKITERGRESTFACRSMHKTNPIMQVLRLNIPPNGFDAEVWRNYTLTLRQLRPQEVDDDVTTIRVVPELSTLAYIDDHEMYESEDPLSPTQILTAAKVASRAARAQRRHRREGPHSHMFIGIN